MGKKGGRGGSTPTVREGGGSLPPIEQVAAIALIVATPGVCNCRKAGGGKLVARGGIRGDGPDRSYGQGGVCGSGGPAHIFIIIVIVRT